MGNDFKGNSGMRDFVRLGENILGVMILPTFPYLHIFAINRK